MKKTDNPNLIKKLAVISIILLMLGFFTAYGSLSIANEKIQPSKSTTTSAFFGANCESALINQIGNAQEEIVIAIYSFTRRNIRDALIKAKNRGVTIRIKYDSEQNEYKGMKQTIGYLRNRGVQCTDISLSKKYAKMHHKFMVIDHKTVITGSYNYSTTASTVNYENLVVIKSEDLAKQFLKEFEHIKDK